MSHHLKRICRQRNKSTILGSPYFVKIGSKSEAKDIFYNKNSRTITTKTEPSDQSKIIRTRAQERFSATKKLPTKKNVVFAS